MLRTCHSGLVRKVAPDFCQSLRSFTKICHACSARTFLIFVSLRGYGETHFMPRAGTRFVRPITLRGAKVPHSLLSFMFAFNVRAPPATPHARPRSHASTQHSTLDGKRVPSISFPSNTFEAFARVIPAFPSVRRDGVYQVVNCSRAIPLVKPGSPMQQPTTL